MTSPSATRAAVRTVDAPFVFGLGLVGVGVAARVAWSARGGALVLLVPPALVAGLVAVGTLRAWGDLRAAASADRELAAFEGREAECSPSLVHAAKSVVDRAASTLPSICILIGLLGTFAGLFEALVGARELLGSAVDAASLRSIVGAPLSGLARAFGSSAAGIVGSIVLAAAEGRFQGAADAVAVRIESIEERLRAAAIGEEVRRAVTADDAGARERAERGGRVEALLERVAKAVEAHAASHANYNQNVVGEIGRLGSRIERLQVAAEATQVAVRESGAASIASSAALEAASREAVSAQLASALKLEAALRELTAASNLSASTLSRVEEATKAAIPEVVSAAERAVAQASVAQREAISSLSAVQESARTALAEAQRAHESREAEARRAHEDRTAALVASIEARAQEGSEALGQATGALREHLARSESALSAAQGAFAETVVGTLVQALEAWSRHDHERSAREDAERRARWEDDDARRAEWSGAEKLILQAAMDMLAERLAVVTEVQRNVASLLEALAATQREFERRVVGSSEAEALRTEASGERMRIALEGGAERVADSIVRQGGALVEALRSELAASVSAVDTHAAALATAAEGVAAAGAERSSALEAHVQAIGANAADVARAVETLAEILRAVPLEVSGASGGAHAAAAPGAVSAASDEDRAAFVACLEEARRWFDATQALQQRFLDEAAQARAAGTRT
jgi:hypothetical protein